MEERNDRVSFPSSNGGTRHKRIFFSAVSSLPPKSNNNNDLRAGVNALAVLAVAARARMTDAMNFMVRRVRSKSLEVVDCGRSVCVAVCVLVEDVGSQICNY